MSVWKDFFYFTKTQRIGIVVLIALIIGTFVALFLLDKLVPTTLPTSSDTTFQQEVEAFVSSLKKSDKAAEDEWKRERWKKYPQKAEVQYRLFAFDPNMADSSSLKALGLKPWIVRNILKYRRKGGYFSSKKDFGRIYGLSAEKFAELAPYISIPPKIYTATVLNEDSTNQPTEDSLSSPIKVKVPLHLELNLADTASLIAIKGIGKYTAVQIVRYRRQLGGFRHIAQLKEIRGITEENYLRIKDHFVIDTALIQKIEVNKASVGQLRGHPYLDFVKAKAIYDYRRRKIELSSFEQLKHLGEFTPEDFEKIRPYLSFK